MASAKDLADCACFNLRKTARAVTQHYDAILAPTGLKATQFTVLAALSIAGAMPLNRAAERLGMNRTTLTRNVRPLERSGWIRSERPADDRRERHLSLTRSGRAAFERALPLWQQAQAGLVQRVGRARWDALRRELGAVIDAAGGRSTSSSS